MNKTTEAQKIIMRRRDQLNIELMQVLEQESAAETVRELQLKQTQDEKERHRLEKIFGMERAKASERIVSTSEKHDMILRQ